VLVVGRNFGCGSSREHAPQAIARWGIRAIVGESFAEIFFGNCVAIGLPCVTADGATIVGLQAAIATAPATELTVDLEALSVQHGATTLPVAMPEGPRRMFLTGQWDACGQLLAGVDAIRTTAEQLPYLSWKTASV
jgi:3-isopropylmalate/(R)-2-methylmalate dehydratase small subunit